MTLQHPAISISGMIAGCSARISPRSPRSLQKRQPSPPAVGEWQRGSDVGFSFQWLFR
jgi:hypothetical protein